MWERRRRRHPGRPGSDDPGGGRGDRRPRLVRSGRPRPGDRRAVLAVLVNGNAVVADRLVLGHGDVVAISASSFVIPAGTVTAVIGPNGSGKTTLLSAIAGLAEPMSGTLQVPCRRQGCERIAYVFQSTKVNESLPISVREVVAMGRYFGGRYRRLTGADQRAIDDAMERTGITGISGRHLHDLSGGQRQRVFVAQGLAQEHELLLLDEPLTGIDLPTAHAIDAVIHDERSRGCTIVLTTHDLSEARVADHVLLLGGRVVASGPPEEVLVPANLAAAYGSALLHLESGEVLFDDPAHRVSVTGPEEN
ncbi:MAG: metal ABC transporter ATP-binding protein [Actinobacteria bacterium]|nr:metal ABC transporter ATP-binding protein [Actinomycetota bacterium]